MNAVRHAAACAVIAAGMQAGPAVPAACAAGALPVTVVDDFESDAAWSARPADGVSLVLHPDAGAHGKSLRLDFDFHGGGGYAVARRAVSIDLPANYAFSFRLRGASPVNHLEFKLVDASGDNVWWHVKRDLAFPRDWRPVSIKKRQIQFAWGPVGGGEIQHVAAIEFAITAGAGGAGSVWLDDFELHELPPPGTTPPPLQAQGTSEMPGAGAALAVDAGMATAWSPARRDAKPALDLDLGTAREFGGLVLAWAPGAHAVDYDIEATDDGITWRRLRSVRGANGGTDPLLLPESEARALRIRVMRRAHRGALALRDVRVEPLEWGASREKFFHTLAQSAPRGTYPRGIGGEQPFWTVAGDAAGDGEGLLSEDGAFEPGRGECTLEPFLFESGRLVTWADVPASQHLESGSLPIPTVRWTRDGLALDITAFATDDTSGTRCVRYRITNSSPRRRQGTLFTAVRPFQVNPPAQFLNIAGGTSPIRSLEHRNDAVRINQDRVFWAPGSKGFGAVAFDGGDIVQDFLRQGRLPAAGAVQDSFGAASCAFRYPYDLAPGAAFTASVFASREWAPSGHARLAREAQDGSGSRLLDDARTRWRQRLGLLHIDLPDTVAAQSLQAQIGYIFVNRSGAAIRPGTRSYARSWIRDGALTSQALLRTGHFAEARAFLEWFAPHQYANGKIPCVVDARGADPTPEHDSNGEFIFLVAECLRYDRDLEKARALWPRVAAAVAYLDTLRAERRTPEFRNTEFFGLLPPSISHEGYSAKAMHSYWDDLWALRGYRDAVFLAQALSMPRERQRIETSAAEFARDLQASVGAAMRRHQIDFVPGCADLGDFDATSTTIALSPVQSGDVLPREAVERTFEKYWEFFEARRQGAAWEAFTPYEIRNIGAFVRLGWRDRAHMLLQFFLQSQKPPAWRQWPEVVWHDERTPHFLGDLPHTWVGSDYVRSLLDMLAYERDADQSLVVGAGVPLDWLMDRGLTVKALQTPFGPLDLTMRLQAEQIRVHLEGPLAVPAGGIRVLPPFPWPVGTVRLNGAPVALDGDGAIVVRALPAELVIHP